MEDTFELNRLIVTRIREDREETVEMKELLPGDRFYLTDEQGNRVIDELGEAEWTVKGSPFKIPSPAGDFWSVEVEEKSE